MVKGTSGVSKEEFRKTIRELSKRQSQFLKTPMEALGKKRERLGTVSLETAGNLLKQIKQSLAKKELPGLRLSVAGRQVGPATPKELAGEPAGRERAPEEEAALKRQRATRLAQYQRWREESGFGSLGGQGRTSSPETQPGTSVVPPESATSSIERAVSASEVGRQPPKPPAGPAAVGTTRSLGPLKGAEVAKVGGDQTTPAKAEPPTDETPQPAESAAQVEPEADELPTEEPQDLEIG